MPGLASTMDLLGTTETLTVESSWKADGGIPVIFQFDSSYIVLHG